MCRSVATLFSGVLIFGLLATASYGQLDGVYEFDGGGDGTSWDDATNWEQVLDPFGAPISGDPATPPGPTTSAEIPLTGVVIDNTMPGQTALDVRIGTAAGAGSMSMSGGDLTARDFNIGADGAGTNAGSFDLSGGMLISGDDVSVGNGTGSAGSMTMSNGSVDVDDDFNVNADSTLTVTGGTIHVGDRLQLFDNGHLQMEGGEIIAEDDFFILDTATVTIEGGLMATIDKLNMGDATPAGPARLIINGGIMRSNEWTDNSELEFDDPTRFMSVIEINGSGKLQVEQATLPVAEAKFLIAEGVHLTTGEAGPLKLGVQTVIVPDFFGEPNVVFTQISVVPEPATVVLLSLGMLGLVMLKRKA